MDGLLDHADVVGRSSREEPQPVETERPSGPARAVAIRRTAQRAAAATATASTDGRPPPFPFSAIVAQEEMKRALLLAAIDPTIGGVLIFGDRGTGKSTAVRALAALLPPMRAVVGDPYHRAPQPGLRGQKTHLVPVPVVDLPLGATEDRVVGALDLEKALVSGEKAFQPGLLARAHRGFLYIDEANLLEDHLVDVLLDVAASGENVVEREGLSIRHPARFVLVGSPEQVAARIYEYQALGIDCFILSGYPHLEEAYRFAELVFPLLKLNHGRPAFGGVVNNGPFGETIANDLKPDQKRASSS